MTSSSLEGCVTSLLSSIQVLGSAISILDTGVNDFPRLSKVLNTTRHFELISDPDLQLAQSALMSEIKPEVESLLNRVSNYLDKLERREQSLIAKSDLNEGRLSQNDGGRASSQTLSRKSGFESSQSGVGISGSDELKYKILRQKKERLSYAVDRLNLQAQQRERQLRMSMAAPHLYQ